MKINISPDLYYRGITGTYSPDYQRDKKVVWITKDRDYALEYSGGKELLVYRFRPRSSFDFGFRTLQVHVKAIDVLDRVHERVLQLYDTNKISSGKAQYLLDKIESLVDTYKNSGMKKVWEWWTAIPQVLELLNEMGFDSIRAVEGLKDKIETIGVLDKSRLTKI